MEKTNGEKPITEFKEFIAELKSYQFNAERPTQNVLNPTVPDSDFHIHVHPFMD